jgi:hypothetical protein
VRWVRCYCSHCLHADPLNRGWLVREPGFRDDYNCPTCGRECSNYSPEEA